MGKKKHHTGEQQTVDGDATPKLSRKEYEAALRQLQVELVHLQEWVVDTRAKVCVVFEGRDGAGKGGVIKRITERVSPRVFRVVALPAPTEREKTQMYLQRYMPHFPAGGEVVIFDRSWYNRAGVERVMGFCTEEEADRFLALTPLVEQAMVDSGIVLLKYWLEVSPEEQTRRLEDRIDDGRKTWKLSPMDLESYSRWYDYSQARDDDVRRHRHRCRAVVRRRLQRQEARAASTSSATCSITSRTRRDPRRRSSFPIVRRRATTARPSTRGGSSPNGSDGSCGQPDWSEYPGWVPSTTRRSFADASPLRYRSKNATIARATCSSQGGST